METRVITLDALKKPKSLTIGDIYYLADGMSGSVIEGHTCPLEMLARYKAFIIFAESVQVRIEREALAEYERHCEGGRNEVSWGDLFSISKTTTGSKWDYTHDSIHQSICEEIKKIEDNHIAPLKNMLKERETYLRQLANSPYYERTEQVNGWTGEVFTPVPATQIAGKETLRFNIKK